MAVSDITVMNNGVGSILNAVILEGSGDVTISIVDSSKFPADGTGEFITLFDKDDPQKYIDQYTGWTKVGNTLTGCVRKESSNNAGQVGDVLDYGLNEGWLANLKTQLTTMESTIGATVYDAVDEAAQLALTGILKGDFCLRSDESKTYVALNSDNVNMGDWKVLLSAGGQTLYDVVVDAGGDGDYTKLSTAFAAEGAKNYFFISGDTETSDVTVPENASMTCPDSEIEINGGKLQPHANGNSSLFGKLTITGTGNAAERKLLDTPESSGIIWGGCEITLKPIGDGLINGSSGQVILSLLQGYRNTFNVTLYDGITYNTTDETWIFYLRNVNGNNEHKLKITNLTNSGTGVVYGIVDYVENGIVDIMIDGITSVGNGYGIEYKATSVNTVFRGIIQDCKTGNTAGSYDASNNDSGLIS